jgi:hypothetical protein
MPRRKWWTVLFAVAFATNSGCRLFCDRYCDRREREEHGCCAPTAAAPAPAYYSAPNACCTPPTSGYVPPVAPHYPCP